jgi:hypothetical protein
MTPIDAVRTALVAPPHLNAIQRLWVPRPQPRIEVTWNGASARFLVPSPADTLVRIGRCLEAIQRNPK